MNEKNFIYCVLNSRVRVGNDVGTIKFIGEVSILLSTTGTTSAYQICGFVELLVCSAIILFDTNIK